jgi:hypothetical protein
VGCRRRRFGDERAEQLGGAGVVVERHVFCGVPHEVSVEVVVGCRGAVGAVNEVVRDVGVALVVDSKFNQTLHACVELV